MLAVTTAVRLASKLMLAGACRPAVSPRQRPLLEGMP
jgi:hypothetical protein